MPDRFRGWWPLLVLALLLSSAAHAQTDDRLNYCARSTVLWFQCMNCCASSYSHCKSNCASNDGVCYSSCLGKKAQCEADCIIAHPPAIPLEDEVSNDDIFQPSMCSHYETRAACWNCCNIGCSDDEGNIDLMCAIACVATCPEA